MFQYRERPAASNQCINTRAGAVHRAPVPARISRELLYNITQETPAFGIFQATFDNSKKRAGKPIQRCEAYGSLYPDKHVHLHTQDFHITDFVSLQQMLDELGVYGHVELVWLDADTAKIPGGRA